MLNRPGVVAQDRSLTNPIPVPLNDEDPACRERLDGGPNGFSSGPDVEPSTGGTEELDQPVDLVFQLITSDRRPHGGCHQGARDDRVQPTDVFPEAAVQLDHRTVGHPGRSPRAG